MTDNIKIEVILPESDENEEFDNGGVKNWLEDYEEVTPMKTEVIEESYNFEDEMEADKSDYFLLPEKDVKLEKRTKIENVGSNSEEEKMYKNEYTCKSCYLGFTIENDLESHFKMCHCKKEKHLAAFVCPFCKLQMLEEVHHRRHIKNCKRRGHVTPETEKKFKCDKCSYGTNWKTVLERHLLVHNNKRQYVCETCGLSFKRKCHLQCHNKIHNTEREKNIVCPHCNNTYYSKYHLASHINLKHLNHKEYRCEKCAYKTAYKCSLDKHVLRKHSDAEKMYKCKDCKYSTHFKSCLVSHLRSHTNRRRFIST